MNSILLFSRACCEDGLCKIEYGKDYARHRYTYWSASQGSKGMASDVCADILIWLNLYMPHISQCSLLKMRRANEVSIELADHEQSCCSFFLVSGLAMAGLRLKFTEARCRQVILSIARQARVSLGLLDEGLPRHC